MVKKMLINATHPEEYRVAIVEDGLLAELDIEVSGHESTRGNIYKAVVVRVETGLQAAFIDFGAERLGFLQMGELHPSFFKAWKEKNGDKGRPRINDVLHRGQELLVQVVKEERTGKGAALTTHLSLAGRFMVLMPGSDTKGVSRKIEEEGVRKKLKQAMGSLELPEQMGYIVRTAAIGQKKEELQRDFDYLVRLYENIRALAGQVKAPSLVYRESNLVIRSIRDYFSPDMDEVLVDDPKVFEEAREFFQQVMPDYARLVKLHQERRPIFARYQIEEQIETINQNRVPLPSGGSIVIDTTEALVAVDVNSGKTAGEQGVEGTAYRANLEAATETARQLRLRDLGGLIVIDFIDMRDRKHIREIEKILRDALKRDKARTTVGRISQFGMLEMSRQRIKSVLGSATFRACPHCHGTGRVKSAESQAIAFLRRIHAAVAKNQYGRVECQVPLEVASYLLNNKREELIDLERRHRVAIHIHGHHDLAAGEGDLNFHKRQVEGESAEVRPIEPGWSEPAPPVAAEPEPGPEVEAEGEEQAEPKSRKRSRRRRRGRKKEGGTEAGGAEETPSGSSGSPEETASARQENSAGDGGEPEAVSAGEEEAPPVRSRRKRNRGRRGKGRQEGEGLAAQESAPPVAQEEPPATLASAGDQEAPPKPKPARSPRKSAVKKAEPESAEKQPAAEEPAPPVAKAPAPAGDQEAPKPKQARARRKPAAKKAEPEAAEKKPAAEEPAPPVAKTPAPAGDQEAAPKPKPARARRKPAAKKEASPSSGARESDRDDSKE